MSRGFTLLQISILLIVASLVLVNLLPSTRTNLNANNATTAKLNGVLTAMRGYEAAHAALPCPADASQPIGSNSYGVAAANPGTGSPGNCTGGSPAANYADATNNVAVGMVPVRTLGLSNDYALDAFGRDITFAVDTNATVCFSGTLPGKITVTDNGTAYNTIAALVSHGADGHGAWIPLTGSSGTVVRLNAGSTDTNELLNAHVNGSFTPYTPLTNFVRSLSTATFGDLLVYKSNLWTLNTAPAASAPLLPSVVPPSNGTYYTGQTLTFTVTYGNTVAVTGTPELALSIPQQNGSTARYYATYVSSSGNTATFSYAVQATDYAPTPPSSVSISSPINLNGGSISVGGAAACLTFTPPSLTGILLNPTTIYVQDGGNYRVQVFNPSGVYLSQFGSSGAGNGQFGDGSGQPNYAGIAIDQNRNVWVGDFFGYRLEEFSASGSYLSKMGGTYGSGNGQDDGMAGFAFDASGNLFIADYWNTRVQKLSASGTYLSQFGSNGSANGKFGGNGGGASPAGVAIAASGNIWTVDDMNNRLQEFNSSGTWLKSIGGPSPYTCETSPSGSLPACASGGGNGQFANLWGIAIDAGGNLWVSDGTRVQEFDSNGNYLSQFGSSGAGNGQFMFAGGIAIDSAGNIWVVDHGLNRVQEFSSCGTYLNQFGGSGSGNGQFNSPYGIAISPSTPGGGGACVASVTPPSSGAYSTGQTLTFTVTYNSAVTVTGTPQLVLTIGSNTDYANYLSGSGTTTLTFTYVIQSSDTAGGIAMASSINLNSGTITTTGNGVGANLTYTAPTMGGIIINSSAFMLIADSGNNRVQKFDLTGDDYVMQFGSSGSGNGQFSSPFDSVTDSGGNIWVTDSGNCRVEEFNSSGTYTSQFGSCGSGNGQLNTPRGIAIDGSGNFWVADSQNSRVEEFNSSGTYQSQFGTSGAGNGQFSTNMQYIHLDAGGNIYVSDKGNNNIQKFSGSGGYTATFGPTIANAPSGTVSNVNDLTLDGCNHIWIEDNGHGRVVEVDHAGNYVTSFADNGGIQSLGIDGSSNLYVLDATADKVDIYNSSLTLSGTFGSSGSGNGQFSGPLGITVVGSAPTALPLSSCSAAILSAAGPSSGNYTTGGTLGFAVTYDQAVTVTGTPEIALTIGGTTRYATYISGSGTATLTFQYTVVGADIGGVSEASAITLNGGTIANGSSVNVNVNFTAPTISGVTVNLIGSYFISDTFNSRIRVVNVSTGDIFTIAGNGTNGYSGDGGAATSAEISNNVNGLALDSSGNVYIADTTNNRIRKVNMSTGIISTVAGNGTAGYSGDGGAATSAEINLPGGIAVDSSGNIYIADNGNNRIRKVTASAGDISTIAGNGTSGYTGDGGAATSAKIAMRGMAADSSGNVYIADNTHNVIREVSASTGQISTVAGNGTAGYSGDGGLATSAELNGPRDAGTDSAGNIYIPEFGNNRVREVTVSTGKISTVVGNGTAGFSGDGGAATSAELQHPYEIVVGR